jgi:hypothetical protein
MGPSFVHTGHYACMCVCWCRLCCVTQCAWHSNMAAAASRGSMGCLAQSVGYMVNAADAQHKHQGGRGPAHARTNTNPATRGRCPGMAKATHEILLTCSACPEARQRRGRAGTARAVRQRRGTEAHTPTHNHARHWVEARARRWGASAHRGP